jgi:TatD DNase family protein
MNLFDSHSHFNDEHFDNNLDEMINYVHNNGVEKLTVAGWNVDSSIKAIEIAKKYDFVYATCGISPNDVDDSNRLNEIEELIKNNSINNCGNIVDNSFKLVAVGEIGLDYYWNKDNKELQKRLFIEQIDLANKYNLPIQIHTRDASIDTLTILKEHPVNKKGIFHCCPLNQELIKGGLELGFYISFSGNVTFKNAKSANDCIKLVPLDRILIETDSPYLTPEPNRGKRNDSSQVVYVAQKIANVLEMPFDEIVDITNKNACRIFNIKIDN